jgi:hypothetical protein
MQKMTITKITQQAFAQNGPLQKFIKNYAPNPVQSFDVGSREQNFIDLLEAGTGISKTLGFSKDPDWTAHVADIIARASVSSERGLPSPCPIGMLE